MATNKITYNDNDKAIVGALKNAPEGLTLAQLREVTGIELQPGHITGASRKGLIEAIGEANVQRPSKRNVSTYNFVTAAVNKDDEGKDFNYTDGEKAILSVASTLDNPFTLADLAKAMGKEKMSSGSINGLVKKGNFTKGEDTQVPCMTKSTVKVYGFVKDIPADAE